ncbi:MAG: 16S rRNA (uracil(1498)-N(3))-methyltransferase [Pseudomonadota bacterium]
MSNTRFYSAQKLNIGGLIPLSASAATHATRALRLNVGDKLKLFNGDGFDYSCELISVKKSEVIAKVLTSHAIENESPLDITLLQGISSGDRMDYTIQKAVELGVRAIQPISTERSVVKLNQERAQKRLEHWQNIVISACEQSGRAFVPQVLPPVGLSKWLADNPQKDATRILLNPIGALKIVALTKPTAQIQLLIGAEGGLSQSEIEAATSQGFQSVILGPRILRTETAALTAIATMQSLWGDY